MLALLCCEALEALPTSLQDDERLMAGMIQSRGERLRLGLAWRIGYKRVLHRGFNCSQKSLHFLRSK